MSPERLLKYFDQICEAPDAVPRLRRFILDIAVRGKLLPQKTEDEPASELLKRIDAEVMQHTETGKIIKKQSFLPIDDRDVLFEIPKNWSWVRLGNIGEWGSGCTPSRGNNEYFGGGITWLKSGELEDNLELKGSRETVTEKALKECSFRLNKAGDVLIAMYGATIGKLAILGETAVTNQAVCGCTPFGAVYNRYLFTFLLSQREYFHSQSEGGAQPNISKIKIVNFGVALPPLAEQHRIVTKVDELMALCDKIEAAQAKREKRRDRLVAATLHGLNNGDASPAPGTCPIFKESARFYLNHLPRLSTRPEHIHQLRQTILNLAIRGKLVPQDPNDEPAEELLARIAATKLRLQAQGRIGREKLVDPVETDNLLFEIPESWRWAKLAELTELITKGSSPKWQGIGYTSESEGVLFITSENVGNYRLRKLDDLKYVEKRFNEIEPRSILKRGDILMNLVGASIGRTAIYDLHDGANINQAVALIRQVGETEGVCPGFLLRYLNSPFAIDSMLSSRVVTAQPNISLTDARNFAVPLPPLAEQLRIVAKVDQLMAVCGELESGLAATTATRVKLLEASLQEAFTK